MLENVTNIFLLIAFLFHFFSFCLQPFNFYCAVVLLLGSLMSGYMWMFVCFGVFFVCQMKSEMISTGSFSTKYGNDNNKHMTWLVCCIHMAGHPHRKMLISWEKPNHANHRKKIEMALISKPPFVWVCSFRSLSLSSFLFCYDFLWALVVFVHVVVVLVWDYNNMQIALCGFVSPLQNYNVCPLIVVYLHLTKPNQRTLRRARTDRSQSIYALESFSA